MSMPLRKDLRVKQKGFISTTTILLLIAIGLLALVEKGPTVPGVPIGASPINPLSLGTSKFVELASRNYTTFIVYRLRDLENIGGEICLYITVSPEIPYTVEESKTILSILRNRCSKLRFLIADESTYSNPLLQTLNSSIRIEGSRIYRISTKITTAIVSRFLQNISSPYPLAEITVRDTHRVVLDKASAIHGGTATGYTYTSSRDEVLCVIDLEGEISRCSQLFVVAAKESIDRAELFVIGDGSILLNQVLLSNRSEYLSLAEDLLAYLCEENPRCVVVFDAMHYTTLSIRSVFSNPYPILGKLLQDPLTLIYIALSIIALLLHPSTWLPPLIQWLSNVFTNITIGSAGVLTIAISTWIMYRVLAGGTKVYPDQRLAEQIEEEVGVFAELKKSILRTKVKLSKQDFIAICQTLDVMLTLYSGYSLWSDNALNILSDLLGDREKAYRELKWIYRLYRKAFGESRLPLIVLWGRATKRLVSIVDEVGKRIGEKLGVNIV